MPFPFFTRPNFEDRQQVQYSGTSITLSGDTNIDSTGNLRIYKDAFPGLVATSLDSNGTVVWGPISGISWSVSACTSPLYVNNIVACPSTGDTIQVDAGNLALNGELNFLIALSAGTTTDNVLVIDSGGFVKSIPQSSITPIFTGGTGTCITDLYVTNIHGCSPIHIQPTSAGDVILVEGGGNVGIGMSSPSEKLDISGKTKTTTLQVTSGATAGYVLTALDSDGNAAWQDKKVEWSRTLFVNPNEGNDLLALPYRVDKPYQTPEAAIAVAVSGDTILFQSGTYTVNGNWGKDGLTYKAIGDVVVNQVFFGDHVFTEPDANPIDIRVIGDFRFVSQPVNFLFWKTNINSKFYIDIEEVTANWTWAVDDSGSAEGDFFLSVNRVLRGTYYNRIIIAKNGYAKINIKYADTRNGYQGVFILAIHENPLTQKGIVEVNVDFALSNANFGDYIQVINNDPTGIQQGKMTVNYKGTIIHTIDSPYGFLNPNDTIKDFGNVLCVLNGGGHINFDGIIETDGGIASCISKLEFSGYLDTAPSSITANIQRGKHTPLPYFNNPSYFGYIAQAHGKNANIRLTGVVNSDSKGALFSVGDYPHTYGTGFGWHGGRINHAGLRVTNKGSGCFMAKRGLITQAIFPPYFYPSIETMYIDNNCEFVSENPNPTQGGITEYTITNSGTNYPDGYYYNWGGIDNSIPISGTGIDAKVSLIIQGGQIVFITPSQLGIDYNEGETITIDPLDPILPQGRIDTFSISGTSVGSSTFTNIMAVGGSGTLATFDVTEDGLGGYSAIVNSRGINYLVSDVLTIDGSYIGGVSGVNDATITVNSLLIGSGFSSTVSVKPLTDIQLTMQNSVDTFSFTGTSVGTNIYTNISGSSTTGGGENVTFDIITDGIGGYVVTLNEPGTFYTYDSVITILGSVLGGVDGVNDLIITILTLAQDQKIKIQGKYIGNNQKDNKNVDAVGLFTYGISSNLEFENNI